MDHRAAIQWGLDMHQMGADIIDIGGESTRPGSSGVDADIELARIEPVVTALVSEGVVVSVDTSKPEVASVCLDAGAEIINDVTALSDPLMAKLCAETDAAVVLMHMMDKPRTMQNDPSYGDVIEDVATMLEVCAARAIEAGVERDRICLDPGIGFGKTFLHNLDLLRGLSRISGADGYPVLVGPSRKSFLGRILDEAGYSTVPVERDAATGAAVALAIAQGAFAVRVHDVSGAIQSARTADAIVRSWQ